MTKTQGEVKMVTEIPTDFLSEIRDDLNEIKRGLQNVNIVTQSEYLTADEFMQKVKVSRWKFDALVREGLLQNKKIGRKFYIPANQVQKYFDGEMVLK